DGDGDGDGDGARAIAARDSMNEKRVTENSVTLFRIWWAAGSTIHTQSIDSKRKLNRRLEHEPPNIPPIE
ncbi:hypothetical protein, partial [Burkholderia sp. 9777_1386]|uniref:hypothetical protein n=1 Tax=Burkholderia sp. 9777_1386 TaxID=2751183 RepID=UPI001E63DF46